MPTKNVTHAGQRASRGISPGWKSHLALSRKQDACASVRLSLAVRLPSPLIGKRRATSEGCVAECRLGASQGPLTLADYTYR